MSKSKYPGAYVDHGDIEYEYDCGPENFTGDFSKLSPHIQEVADDLTKQAFPEGKEAFQKERAAKK